MNPKPESAAFLLGARLSLVLIFGLLYAFLTPPFEAPDEPAHFARAYGLAEGQIVLRDHPRELILFFCRILETRPREDVILRLSRQALEEHPSRIPNLALNTALYSPLPYVFHAVAARAGMLFGKSFAALLATLYLCRVLSALGFGLSLFLASRLFPRGAWLFFWIAVTPMALSQAGTVSPDWITLGAGFLLLATSLGRTAGKEYLGWLSLAMFFLVLTKPTSVPLLLIPLGMQAMLKTRRSPLTTAVVWLAGLLAVLGAGYWQYWSHSAGVFESFIRAHASLGGLEIDPGRHLLAVLFQPVEFLRIVLFNLKSHGITVFHQFVGVLGWLDKPTPVWVAVLWAALAPAALLAGGPFAEHERRSTASAFCILSAILTFFAIYASAYLVWTPVGSTLINVQGRYFHPVAAAFLMGVGLLLGRGDSGRRPTVWPAVLLVAGATMNLAGLMVAAA